MPNAEPNSWSMGIWDDRRIVPADPGDSHAPAALIWRAANALDADTWAMPDPVGLMQGSGLVVRSGWQADGEDEPRPLWLAGPRNALAEFAGRVEAQATSASLTPVMLARAGDVLSDVPSLTLFLRSHAGRGWRMLVAPTLLLTPTMVARAEEHLERIVAQCAGHEALWGWLACEPAFGPGGTTPRPLRAGSEMTMQLVRALQAQGGRRVVVVGDQAGQAGVESQRRLLSTPLTPHPKPAPRPL